MSAKKANEPTFEEAIAGLEAIIEKIETGEIGLEESLLHYERGMKLVTRCRGILDTAEQRIAELTRSADGNVTIERSSEPSGTQSAPIQAERDDVNGSDPSGAHDSDHDEPDYEEEAPF